MTDKRIKLRLGKIIKAARLARGMSLNELGRLCETDAIHISKIEHGMTMPSSALGWRICRNLGISMDASMDQAMAEIESGKKVSRAS